MRVRECDAWVGQSATPWFLPEVPLFHGACARDVRSARDACPFRALWRMAMQRCACIECRMRAVARLYAGSGGGGGDSHEPCNADEQSALGQPGASPGQLRRRQPAAVSARESRRERRARVPSSVLNACGRPHDRSLPSRRQTTSTPHAWRACARRSPRRASRSAAAYARAGRASCSASRSRRPVLPRGGPLQDSPQTDSPQCWIQLRRPSAGHRSWRGRAC